MDTNIFTNIAVVIALLVGILLVYSAFTKQDCPPQKIVYKYIPRTFAEEQMNPVKVSDIFSTMFSSPSILT